MAEQVLDELGLPTVLNTTTHLLASLTFGAAIARGDTELRSLMRRSAVLAVSCALAGALLLSGLADVSAQGPPLPPPPQHHLWHADYTLEYVAPTSQGDEVADGLYAFTYGWNFGILNDPTASLGPSTISVTRPPDLGPLTPFVSPGGPGSPVVTLDPNNLIWSVPGLLPSGRFFGSIRSDVPVPAPQFPRI